MNKRVLIVDDSSFMRMIIKSILEPHGYEIVGEASDGTEALEKYKSLKPDLVTMDITMPTMDGISSLIAIKEFDPDALVIMISAMGQQLLVIESIQAGAKDFIVKPFNEDNVLLVLSRLFND